MRPIPEVMAAVGANPSLRKSLGRGLMFECCAVCELAVCASTSSACRARQERNRQQRAFYAARRGHRRQQARRDYAKHAESRRAKSRIYQSDPGVLEAMALKRRMRYAAIRGTVRPYRWTNPAKNKAPANV